MSNAVISNSITKLDSESSDNTKTETFKISIQLIGIKKRCRKSERHFFQLGRIPYNNGEFNREEVEQLVRDFVATNVKELRSIVRVSLDHVISGKDGLFHIEQWEPFSKLNKTFDMSI